MKPGIHPRRTVPTLKEFAPRFIGFIEVRPANNSTPVFHTDVQASNWSCLASIKYLCPRGRALGVPVRNDALGTITENLLRLKGFEVNPWVSGLAGY